VTQEEKELLLKYLCMALPYGVKVQHQHENYLDEIQTVEHISRQYGEIETESVLGFVDDFKPYLRTMSSMTEEEKTQMVHNCYVISLDFEHKTTDMVALWNTPRVINWLLEHHFDFLGLISKGLAIEVTESNNPY
jgi:hypothetical protein